MADENRFRRFVKDKAVLLILAVVLVVPVAAYLAVARQAPVIAESGSDLKALPADEKHVVTRRLKDTDLEALERFTSLEELQLHYCDMTDAGAPYIAAHTGLRRLVVNAMALTDAGVATFAVLSNLEELILVGCVEVTSSGLQFLPQLPNLKSLVLNQCIAIDDDIAEILVACPNLRNIELEVLRNLTDRSCETLAKRPDITRLNLDMSTRITRAGVVHLGKISALEWLSLHGIDSLTDDDLPIFAGMANLKHLQLPLRAEFSNDALEQLRAELPNCQVLYKESHE
jgi:hypothetical protein